MPPRSVKFSKEDILKSKPLKNKLIKWKKISEEEILITFERRRTGWINFLSKIFYLPKEKSISLDEVGSEVWNMCDGKNTVGEIIDKLSQNHKLNPKEAESSLLAYLKQLAQRGMIGFSLNKGMKNERK